MSMILYLRRAKDGEIRELLENPQDVTRFLTGEALASETDFLARLLGEETGDATEENRPPQPVRNEKADLDKAWHGIHYLLTGTAWEGEELENFIILGGREIGNIDVGYGPARAFESREVQAISQMLSRISEETLRSRYNPEEMDTLEIYPTIFERDGEEAFDYLKEYFYTLKDFIATADAADDGIIMYMA